MKAIRAIIAAVADLLRAGRMPIARERVIVNLDTTPVQLHTTTFQTGDPTGARNFSYLDRIRDTALHRWAFHRELQPRPCVVRRRRANRGFQPHRPYRPVWWPRTSRRSSIPRPRSVLLGPGRFRHMHVAMTAGANTTSPRVHRNPAFGVLGFEQRRAAARPVRFPSGQLGRQKGSHP